MSARVIVTQQSRNTVALTHKAYDVDSLGLDILGGLQIVSDPGWDITAVYIVADPPANVDQDAVARSNYISLDGE